MTEQNPLPGSGSPTTPALIAFLESAEFYHVMQQYRCAPETDPRLTAWAFEQVKSDVRRAAADALRSLPPPAVIGRWRTYGTPRCPRTFPEIPMVACRDHRSDGCDCWDCVEIRTERQRDRLEVELAEVTQELAHETEVREACSNLYHDFETRALAAEAEVARLTQARDTLQQREAETPEAR